MDGLAGQAKLGPAKARSDCGLRLRALCPRNDSFALSGLAGTPFGATRGSPSACTGVHGFRESDSACATQQTIIASETSFCGGSHKDQVRTNLTLDSVQPPLVIATLARLQRTASLPRSELARKRVICSSSVDENQHGLCASLHTTYAVEALATPRRPRRIRRLGAATGARAVCPLPGDGCLAAGGTTWVPHLFQTHGLGTVPTFCSARGRRKTRLAAAPIVWTLPGDVMRMACAARAKLSLRE